MLLAYLMIPLLQKELDVFKDTIWNTHRIRCQKDTVLPDGVPNHIHAFPEVYGLDECGRLMRNLITMSKVIIFIVIYGGVVELRTS